MNDERQVEDSKNGEKGSEELPTYVIEHARSGRSKCKVCRRAIQKGAHRIGFLIEGPFGQGHLWHHLACAARKHYGRVEEAYNAKAWDKAKAPVENLPGLEELAKKRDEAAQRSTERKKIPYGEVSPSGRARCKSCGEAIEKGSIRVVLGRLVEFGSQVRTTPANVHPGCVSEELEREDSAIEPMLLHNELRANSKELSSEQLEILLESLEAAD